MRLNKEELRALAALGDRDLWAAVKNIAQRYGIKLPDASPSHADLDRLRALLAAPEKIKMSEAIRLVNEYKKKGGNPNG